MIESGNVLDLAPMNVRVEVRRTAAETGGELLEFDVVGHVRGFLGQPHVHPAQTERLEVVSGSLELQIDGTTHVLSPGEVMEVPPGTPHRQRAGDAGDGRVRIQARPALHTHQFLERLAQMSRDGQFIRGGWPKPLAAAALVTDFADEGYAAKPPLAVQQRLARGLQSATSREYEFVDEWDVAAPPEAVFDALADARTYPDWWRPVYLEVGADGPPAIGTESRQHFKGRLPYHLQTRSRITRLEPPHVVVAEVDGDLRGRGVWTLSPTDRGTHVRFDWIVLADRPLLRALTPVLRPAFRWNHNWAIARAMEGLEPYARRKATARRQEAATA